MKEKRQKTNDVMEWVNDELKIKMIKTEGNGLTHEYCFIYSKPKNIWVKIKIIKRRKKLHKHTLHSYFLNDYRSKKLLNEQQFFFGLIFFFLYKKVLHRKR